MKTTPKNLLKPRDRDTLTKSLHTISAVVLVARYIRKSHKLRMTINPVTTGAMVTLAVLLTNDALQVLGQDFSATPATVKHDETIGRIVATLLGDISGQGKAEVADMLNVYTKS